jgi:hypothetical protein
VSQWLWGSARTCQCQGRAETNTPGLYLQPGTLLASQIGILTGKNYHGPQMSILNITDGKHPADHKILLAFRVLAWLITTLKAWYNHSQ